MNKLPYIFISIFFLLYLILAEISKNRIENTIEKLHLNSQILTTEISNLTNGLKSPYIAGKWGELQLKSLLEKSGLLQYSDFEIQKENSNGRPDVAIKLPNQGIVFVDSKVPLTNYLEMLKTNDPKQREILKKEHVKSLKTHIVSLGRKNYWKNQNSPQFVILYVPVDTVILSAMDLDPSILELAYENKVFLSSPINLMMSLNMIGNMWLQIDCKSNNNYPKAIDLIKEIEENNKNLIKHIKSSLVLIESTNKLTENFIDNIHKN